MAAPKAGVTVAALVWAGWGLAPGLTVAWNSTRRSSIAVISEGNVTSDSIGAAIKPPFVAGCCASTRLV